jgi:hypothetical protein
VSFVERKLWHMILVEVSKEWCKASNTVKWKCKLRPIHKKFEQLTLKTCIFVYLDLHAYKRKEKCQVSYLANCEQFISLASGSEFVRADEERLEFTLYTLKWFAFLFCSLFFGGVGATEVWTQGFVPAKQVLFHSGPTFSPFCSAYFGDRVSLFCGVRGT